MARWFRRKDKGKDREEEFEETPMEETGPEAEEPPDLSEVEVVASAAPEPEPPEISSFEPFLTISA